MPLHGVSADTTRADSTAVLARFLEDTMAILRDQELGLLHVDMERFAFHDSLPCLKLGDILLSIVGDESCVISIEKLPWYTCVEPTWRHLQHQNEEQWAKDRTLHKEQLHLIDVHHLANEEV